MAAVAPTDRAAARLPPALAKGIEALGTGLPPEVAARAAAALAESLRPLTNSRWPEVAWTFSRLFPSGDPVELVWNAARPSIRYTTECAAPETAPADRLAAALRMIETLGGATPADALLDRLRALQTGASLDYGAWIGGRHGTEGDAYKLYVECPKASGGDAAVWLGEATAPALGRALGRAEVCMIGADGSDVEFYLRLRETEVEGLPGILSTLDLDHRFEDLRIFLRDVAGCDLRRDWPARPAYLSISTGGRGVSLFVRANSVFGADRSVRRAICRAAEHLGWRGGGYAALTRRLCRTTPMGRAHGIVGFCISRSAPPWLQLGVAGCQV